MTIEVFGHVKSLEFHGVGKVLVDVQIEASRMLGKPGTAPVVQFIATAAEVAEYKPGMGICIQVRPHAYAADGEVKS